MVQCLDSGSKGLMAKFMISSGAEKLSLCAFGKIVENIAAADEVSIAIYTTQAIQVIVDSEYTVAEGDSVITTIMTANPITDSFIVSLTVPSSEAIIVEPRSFNFTSSATTHNFTIIAMADDVVEEEERVVINVTTDAMNVAIQSNMPTVIIQDTTILLRESPQSQGVLLRGEATLTCSFEAGYSVTVAWMRGDDILRDEGDMTSPTGSGLGNYSSVLVISDTMFTDCGSYRCFASGADTVYSQPAELSVVELMGPAVEMVTASVGAVDMLSCTIRHCGSFFINWFITYDNGTVLPLPIEVTNFTVDDVGSTESDLTDLTSVVTINTVGLVNKNESQMCYAVYADQGQFGNIAFKMFDYTSENVDVNVTVFPDRESGNYHEGDDVVLNCTATNPPGVSRSLLFTWAQRARAPHQPERVITSDTAASVTVITGQDYSILTFTDIQDDSDTSDQMEDSLEGIYLCRVTNRERNDWVTVTIPINVISGPTVYFPSRNAPSTVNVGENLTVTCDATSGDNPVITSITIFLEDEIVASSTTSDMLSYTFEEPELSDNGTEYLCSAVNALGTTNATFSLTVRDRPDVIDSETVSSTLLSLLVANLSWTAPNANNDPITEYTVSISSVPDGLSTMTCTVTYLLLQVDPEVEYNVTITATNAVDTSDPSDLVVIMGAMRDDANTTLLNVLTTNLHIVLEWSPPPLSEPLEGDLPSISDFSVDQYILLKDAEELNRLGSNVTEYIYTVEEDDGGSTQFRIKTVYSDYLINDLTPETKLVVDIPTEEGYLAQLPISAREPAEEPITVSNGFTITWNQPELLQNQNFLHRYEVFIAERGRRRRQSMVLTATIEDPITRSYTFNEGQPFTEYNVRVDGVVELNGEEVRVVTLTSTPVRTAEGVSTEPRRLQVTNVGITGATISWSVPASPNGIITEYQVIIDGTSSRRTVQVSVTTLSVTGLHENTEYTVRVRARNGAGLGASASQSFTTDLEPVLFQLRFVGVSDCFQWRETQPGEKKDAIIDSVTRTVDETCQCGFSQESFQDIDATAGFQCFVESPTAVTFRAKIASANSEQLISYIEEWVATQPSIVVLSSRLSIDGNCAVEIDNFKAPECTGIISTINSDNTNSITGSVIGGVVGGLFILLIAVVTLVLIVFLLQRKRQKKAAYKLNSDKKEDIDIYETIPELPSFPLETIHLTAAKNLTQEPITTEDNPSCATHSTERCNPVLTDKQMDITTEDNPSYTTHSTGRCNPVLTDCPISDVRDEGYQNVGDYEIP